MRIIIKSEDDEIEEIYRLVLFKIEGFYDDRPEVNGKSVPAEMIFLDDDDTVELSELSKFVTVFVPESVFGEAPVIEDEDLE